MKIENVSPEKITTILATQRLTSHDKWPGQNQLTVWEISKYKYWFVAMRGPTGMT